MNYKPRSDFLRRPLYYKRDGTPYDDWMDWAKDYQKPGSKIVKQETLPNGYFVSTVWLGLDHSFMEKGPPIIFETMVFKDDQCDLDMARYSTEEDALKGHHKMVKRWSSR